MLTIKEPDTLETIYHYQRTFPSPQFFPIAFSSWRKSFEEDMDGEGRVLFKELFTRCAYDGEKLVGFVQYGLTAFAFDDKGEISDRLSYPVIRNLYFDAGRDDAGEGLLRDALDYFDTTDRVYAFFHYFGMSCFARHGKLFEAHAHIEALLKRHGFVVEHENVYYSTLLDGEAQTNVEILPQQITKGSQQYMDFLLSGNHVGGCEVHFLNEENAYLRWIYVDGNLTGQSIGTLCMTALKGWLRQKGILRFDTDTALSNPVAQHYYEKTGFSRKGITRSYYTP